MLETAVTYSFENILWISAIFVTGYLSWKAAVYFTKLEDTRKKVASLPCEKRKEEIDLHSKNHVETKKFLQPEEIDKIKLDAYNTGVNIVPYMKVIAILARDRYFSEHNILVEDVDKHDPLNKNKKPE